MAESYIKEINAIPRSFSKIIFGTAALKKTEKVYASFHIPSNENIVAYIKSSVPFMGQTTVITDCALYTYLHESIPFSDICKYLIFQADPKAAVSISDGTESQDILGGTILAKNVAGMDLAQFIRELQMRLVQNYTWARQQRDTLASTLFDTVRKEMRTGQITGNGILLLDTLSGEDAYLAPAAMLKAENIYRTCNLSDYQTFLNQLPPSVASEIRKSQEGVSEGFIRDLKNLALDFDRAFLELVYSNLSALTVFSGSQYLIRAYVCARLDKREPFNAAKEQIQRHMGTEAAQQVNFFKGRYCNARMKRVYDAVRSGVMPPEESLEWTDSIGLTPLHYAILLRQEDVVTQMLEKHVWKPVASNREADGAMELLDYTVLACYCGLSNRATVFQNTSDMAAAQRRSRKALERRLFVKERKMDLQNATEGNLRNLIHQARRNKLYDKVNEFQEKLDNLSMLREETQMEIDDIKQAICDIDYEIQELTEDALINAADTIQRLRESQEPITKFLLRLFLDRELLAHILEAHGNCRLYTCQGFSFVTPADVNIDIPYCEQQPEQGHSNQTEEHTGHGTNQGQKEKTQEDEPVVRPYGASWFSPEAHRDMKRLKEEYHNLAKQYHPDRCKHPRSKQIFQEILSERADILENMN